MSAKDELKRLVRTIYMEGFMQVKDVNTDEYVDRIINMFSSELNTETPKSGRVSDAMWALFIDNILNMHTDTMGPASSNTEPTKSAIQEHLEDLARLSERLKQEERVSIKEDTDDIIDDLN